MGKISQFRDLRVWQGGMDVVEAVSHAEVDTQLEIASRLGYVAPMDLNAILEQTATLGKQLYALRDALVRRQ